jgi:leader peptidase (prepilin peptidase)/N-methyltransferase
MYLALDLFSAEEWRIVCIVVAATFGLCIGSFSGVVVHRLPLMLEAAWEDRVAPVSLSHPRSYCPSCGHVLSWWENIPLVSYLLILKGRCRHCNVKIPAHYPVVEIMTAVTSALTVAIVGVGWSAVWALCLVWTLAILAWIDVREQILPDVLTLPLMWVGLLVNTSGVFVSADDAILGAASGYLSLWLLFWFYRGFSGKEAIGFGDFKLMAALGAWLGWVAVGWIFLSAFFASALFGMIWLFWLRRGEEQRPMSFGPFLAFSGWMSLLYLHGNWT